MKSPTASATTNKDKSYHMQSDKRQIGGLLMILGFCAIIMPAANIVSGFGPNGAIVTDPSEIPFWGLVGGLCIFINGIISVLLGFLVTVHDWSHRYLTLLLMVTIQTAWIPYITDMTDVGKAARLPVEDNGFIPLAYDPTKTDVKVIGALGILAILAYGFAFVGSIAFMAFSLHAYNTGKPEERSGAYFQGRLGFYSGVLVLAGFVQAMLGVYCAARFESGVLEDGPVGAAFLLVSYPGISMLVGAIQLLNGLWGIIRGFGFHFGAHDISFPISLALQWILVLALQIIAQIGYLPGGDAAPVAPTVAAFSLGLTLMPAFLDHKMRTLPPQFPVDYYSVDTTEGFKGSVEQEGDEPKTDTSLHAPVSPSDNENDFDA